MLAPTLLSLTLALACSPEASPFGTTSITIEASAGEVDRLDTPVVILIPAERFSAPVLAALTRGAAGVDAESRRRRRRVDRSGGVCRGGRDERLGFVPDGRDDPRTDDSTLPVGLRRGGAAGIALVDRRAIARGLGAEEPRALGLPVQRCASGPSQPRGGPASRRLHPPGVQPGRGARDGRLLKASSAPPRLLPGAHQNAGGSASPRLLEYPER